MKYDKEIPGLLQIQQIDSVILDDVVSVPLVLHFKEMSPIFILQLRGSVLN